MRDLIENNLGIGIVMLILEVMVVGCNTLNKAAMDKGMSNYVFVTYSHAIGFFLLLPSTMLVHWKNPVPPIGFSIIKRIFMLSVFCYCCSILTYIGISYSSPTLASAMNNLSPASTFIIAMVFRMEKLKLRSRSTWLKLIGTMVSIAGAFIVICYRGFPILISRESFVHSILQQNQPNWIIGGLFLATSSTFLSLTYITKTWIARDFHSEVLINLISFFFETCVAAFVALMVEKDTKVWIPSVDIVLIAFIAGAVILSASNVGTTWACRKKGPLFVAMFRPLEMIIAAIMGVCFLKDILHFGSVIGGMIIALGFYTVMKGKADEEMFQEDDHDNILINSSEISSSHKVPLLENRIMDI